VNRGYSSATAMYDASQRFFEAVNVDKKATILYLGDFDPSGLDMIRDVRDRITEFLAFEMGWDESEIGEVFTVQPIAINKAQIQTYNPPPNPAKMSDPRGSGFVDEHGIYSYEVDALPPNVLNGIVTREIEDLIDMDIHKEILIQEKEERYRMKQFISGYE
jgi:hypothetical protein